MKKSNVAHMCRIGWGQKKSEKVVKKKIQAGQNGLKNAAKLGKRWMTSKNSWKKEKFTNDLYKRKLGSSCANITIQRNQMETWFNTRITNGCLIGRVRI